MRKTPEVFIRDEKPRKKSSIRPQVIQMDKDKIRRRTRWLMWRDEPLP